MQAVKDVTMDGSKAKVVCKKGTDPKTLITALEGVSLGGELFQEK